ncbi:MAG: hypothetical protein U5K00_01840 [Melioribacteraceae bacterium]|nr:hypothetical protein [Melioribacteraceae bacterium]
MEKIINNIQPEEFESTIYKHLAEIIYDSLRYRGFKSPSSIIEEIEDENLKRFTLAFAISEEVISKRWDKVHHDGKITVDIEKYADDLIRKYKLQKLDEQIRRVNQEITELTDDNSVIELMKEVKELQNEKKSLLTVQQQCNPGKHILTNSFLFEINTRVWIKRFSKTEKLTIDKVPSEYWNS